MPCALQCVRQRPYSYACPEHTADARAVGKPNDKPIAEPVQRANSDANDSSHACTTGSVQWHP